MSDNWITKHCPLPDCGWTATIEWDDVHAGWRYGVINDALDEELRSHLRRAHVTIGSEARTVAT